VRGFTVALLLKMVMSSIRVTVLFRRNILKNTFFKGFIYNDNTGTCKGKVVPMLK
jgi:hypothetical protein